MYIVIKLFTDLQDNKHLYKVGDVFPRTGTQASDERLEELAGSGNKQGEPLIRLIQLPDSEDVSESEDDPPKKTTRKATKDAAK